MATETSPQQLPSPSASGRDLLSLDVQVCFALHAASRAFNGVYRKLLRDTGLTYPQYLAMLALWEHGEMSVKRLGEMLRLDSGTLSPLLKRMETAGLVSRERSAQDERSVRVRTTEAGEALRETARGIPLEIMAASGLDQGELAALRGQLRRVTEALDLAADGES
ncbi:MarR family winged helix-turn-helix transcriptional regulator [Streptomyces sp. 8N706]|uniref:MarR family winged helix-turn-helix transcriptional regulator n=1 Tax=Streptomyces sp. 8N706 TaxID=3457416 RepID=UPI003FCF0A9B